MKLKADPLICVVAVILTASFIYCAANYGQVVTFEPLQGGLTMSVCTEDLYDANMTHRKAMRGFEGDCKEWTYLMEERLDMDCIAPVLATFRGQPHMALGIWHEDGFFVSDVNFGGIVHVNHAGYRVDAIYVDGRWVGAEIVVK